MARILGCTLCASLILFVFGCDGDPDPSDDDDDDSSAQDDDDDDSATDDDDSATDDDDDTATPGTACSDGTWGAVADPDAAVHVSPDGSDEGDGSASHPLATIDAALEITRSRTEDKIIALWEGDHIASVLLLDDLGGGLTDNDTTFQGCSISTTTVEGASSTDPVFDINGATDVLIEGMSTRGGGRGIQVDSTATVDLVDLSVSTASEVGVFVVGNGTTATLTNVEVHDTSTEAGEYGYGFVFQGGASVTMSGGGAFDNHAVGILADTAIVDIDNVSVEGTVQDADGYLGRGMQLQGDVDAIVSNCALAGNHDTGIFALTAMAVSVSTTTIQATAAADMPNSGEQSGDGIVVSSGDVSYNPADFDTELTGNTIDGSTRAGIVLEGVTVSVSGNQVTGSGYDVGGVSIFAQESAVVSGSDTVENLAEGLDVNRYQISTQ